MSDVYRDVYRKRIRSIVINVYLFLKSEAKGRQLVDMKALQKRTAAAMRMSVPSVRRIIRQYYGNISKQTRSRASRKKSSPCSNVTQFNNYEKGTLKRMIHTYHITDNELPNIKNLLASIRKQTLYQGNEESLKELMKELGFYWVKINNHSSEYFLLENINLRLKRVEYLDNMIRYRNESRMVIFTSEFYLDPKRPGPKVNTSSGTLPSYTYMLLAGCEVGYIPNTLAYMDMRVGGTTGAKLQLQFYQKWIKDTVIPNVPEGSLVVVHNEFFCENAPTPVPDAFSTKNDMIIWLHEHSIPYYAAMCKPLLHKLVNVCKNRVEKPVAPQMFKEKNRSVLVLPPHHPDLNPMNEVWKIVGDHVASRQATVDRRELVEFTKQKLMLMHSSQEFAEFFVKTKNIEIEYMKSDHIIDELTDLMKFPREGLGNEFEGNCYVFPSSEYEDSPTDNIKTEPVAGTSRN